MTDRLTELLESLGSILNLSLVPDKYNACSIEIPPIRIQLQLDSTQEKLFIFSKIIAIPPGKFRENVLLEALKANDLPDPRPGVFCYIANTNHLALYQSYPLFILNGERLAGLFGSFYELGSSWHDSIQKGQIIPAAPSTSKIPFGMRP